MNLITAGRVRVSPPPQNVLTTQPAFTELESTIHTCRSLHSPPQFWVKKAATKNLLHVRLTIIPGKLFYMYVWWICLVNLLQSLGREVQFRVGHLKYFICHICPIIQESDRFEVDRRNWTYNKDDKRRNRNQMSLIKIVEPFVPQTKNVQLLQNSQTIPDLREVNSLLPLHLHLITYYTTYNNNMVTQDNSIISPPLIPWVILA